MFNSQRTFLHLWAAGFCNGLVVQDCHWAFALLLPCANAWARAMWLLHLFYCAMCKGQTQICDICSNAFTLNLVVAQKEGLMQNVTFVLFPVSSVSVIFSVQCDFRAASSDPWAAAAARPWLISAVTGCCYLLLTVECWLFIVDCWFWLWFFNASMGRWTIGRWNAFFHHCQSLLSCKTKFTLDYC